MQNCPTFFRSLFLVLCACCMGLQTGLAQGFQTEFGKNRVQHHEFEWSFYETENFIIYFYQGGKDLAKFAMNVAETEIERIENKLEHQLNNKIELMVYHNNADVRQTNIGLGYDISNQGGITQIVGNKVFVYFNGNHQHLKTQLVEGISKVHFESLVFGSSLQEIIQNAVLLNLPEWFISGLIAYISEDWSVELDDQLRKVLKDEKFKKFNHLTDAEARFAGHSLWHYITENYGESAIPNILYLTRINRSVESGFLFVLGSPVQVIIEEWWASSLQKMEAMDDNTTTHLVEENLLFETKETKRNIVIDQVEMSEDGKKMAYATNEKGLIKVFIRDLETGETKKLLKTGFKTYNLPIPHTYPLFSWNKSSKKLAMVYEKRDDIYLLTYNTLDDTKEIAPITKFQQVLDIDFTDDDRRVILSAVKNGQCDLFSYFIPNTRVTQLTQDFYDDLDVDFVKMGDTRGVVFRSNRLNDTLTKGRIDSIMPTGNYDIFFYNLDKPSQPLVQLTNTPFANEKIPTQYNEKFFSYLSDENGIYNRFAVRFDSTFVRTDQVVYFKDSTIINPVYPLDSTMMADLIDSIQEQDIYKITGKSFPLTNSHSNLLFYDVAHKKGEVLDVEKGYRNYKFYKKATHAAPDSVGIELKKTPYKALLERTNAFNGKASDIAAVTRIKGNSTKKEEKKKESTGGWIEENFAETPTTPTSESEETTETREDKIDTDNYFFQSEFEDTEEEKPATNENTDAEEKEAYKRKSTNSSLATLSVYDKKQKSRINHSRVRAYSPKFAIDYIASQLDNSIIAFNQYQSYQYAPTGYFNPNLKAMIRFGISDLFEDYKITGGFRIPFSGLDHTEYFVEFRNLRKQLDKQWVYYRKNETFQFPQIKNITNYLQHTISYPLDITSRIAAHVGYRHHKLEFLSADIQTLPLEAFQEQWLQTKVEYVFDNTFQVATNVLNGTRYKIYAEYHKNFQAIVNDSQFDFAIQDLGYLGIFGGDFRHYQKIHRQIIWANRLSFAKSIGTRKMLYFLGAVDNWLTLSGSRADKQDNRFDYTAPVDPEGTANYGFQSLTPNLRGFKYNVRNGSNYVLWNSEVRVPLFAYLVNRPMKSQFLRDFQVIGFFDAGTAWEVGSPFSKENRYYTYIYPTPPYEGQAPPVITRVQYFKNPIVMGYGWGLRSTLLGYYIKFDWAWGVDSGRRNEGMRYLSLGWDF